MLFFQTEAFKYFHYKNLALENLFEISKLTLISTRRSMTSSWTALIARRVNSSVSWPANDQNSPIFISSISVVLIMSDKLAIRRIDKT